MKILLVVPVVLLLVGCTENLAIAARTGLGLQLAGDAYLFENIAARQWVRAECREILDAELTKLKAAGEYAKARQLLRDNYPPLVGLSIIADAKEGDVADALTVPPGCGADMEVTTE